MESWVYMHFSGEAHMERKQGFIAQWAEPLNTIYFESYTIFLSHWDKD